MLKLHGFSLIELMVVIAIVAVLATVAVPAYKNYLKTARYSSALVALKAMNDSALEYIQTYDSLPPDLSALGLTPDSGFPLQTPIPTTRDEFLVKPDLIAFFLNGLDPEAPGVCQSFNTGAIIYNSDEEFTSYPANDMLFINSGFVDVNGTIRSFCDFQTISGGSFVTSTITLPNCVNASDPVAAQAQTDEWNALKASCP